MSSSQPVHSWDEPEGIAPRGTLVSSPGRVEHGGVYERFGRRTSPPTGTAYGPSETPPWTPRPSSTPAAKLLRDETLPGPRVLVGSDSGASYAATLAARETTPGLTH
ncbi:hypothetical protein GCM10011428_57470 [Streptomyces violaceus]|uniref:hypothetical protein n=1 Tax=Streptomyces violaceus TaxID=1936 RepID=UPI0031E907E9